MIILDTDAISELMRPQPTPTLLARLAETPAHEQATTAITMAELCYGAHEAGRPELYERAVALLAGVDVRDFDRPAAEQYGWLRVDLERAGQPFADPDLRIAAIAMACGATVISGNLQHFARIPGLAVNDWIRGTGDRG